MNEIGTAICFGVLSLFLLISAWKRDFFSLPQYEGEVPIRFSHLVGAFAIYFITTTLATKLAIDFLKEQIMAHFVAYSCWLNFGISFLVFIFLAIYLLLLPRETRRGILLRSPQSFSFYEDLWTALSAWVIAFPLVLFLSQILELIVVKAFQVTQVPDQTAVKFLKSTFDNPLHFFLAVTSIVLLAPLVEETLFRGFLQSFIRKHLGTYQAILITSVCFSLFHYSYGQGLGNISIILSLFFLSLFLGFLYEKRGSLFASMILHSAFNTVSVINLYLFGGFTTGL